jgi:formate/nitrite transporter FocA (FNT family)
MIAPYVLRARCARGNRILLLQRRKVHARSARARAGVERCLLLMRIATRRTPGSRMPDNQRAGAKSPHLTQDEQSQAADHATPRALVIHEIIREEGESALQRTTQALAWSALAAGLSMGFSFLTQAVLQSALPAAPWRHLVASFGYCVGFIIVILGRQQLFTESTLTAVLPVLTRGDAATLLAALRLWGIVLLANLAGTAIFAALLNVPGVFEPHVTGALVELSAQVVQGRFWSTLLRALFAGWLIALMVWLLPNARSAQFWTVLLITYVVAVSCPSHVIAGSVEAAYAVLSGHASPADYLVRFLAPTWLGNVIGGVSLVAMLNHASIAPEIVDRRENPPVRER